MNIKDLLEMELGKSKEHESIISQREKFLKDKIKEKEKTKEKTLRKIEDLADELTIGEHGEKGMFDFFKKYGGEVTDEVLKFLNFSIKKIEEYSQDKETINIPIGIMPTIQGMVLNSISTSIGKNERKIIEEIIKKEKPKNAEDIIRILNTPGNEMYNKLEGKIPGLDIEDLEEFINKVSNDKELKSKISKINNSLSRFYSIYAKNKHLSTTGSSKKIKL